jgi:tetratricopeptide (TPR) repeat protein
LILSHPVIWLLDSSPHPSPNGQSHARQFLPGSHVIIVLRQILLSWKLWHADKASHASALLNNEPQMESIALCLPTKHLVKKFQSTRPMSRKKKSMAGRGQIRARKSERIPAHFPERRTVFWVCLFLVAIIWVVFGQTGQFEFVNYDDQKNVYENPVVEKGLSLPAVGWAFTHAQVANWIPLTTLSHMLDCQIFGLHAGGHHLVNVLLHTANAVLLFLVLRQMTGSLWRSAFVAAVFAVHPLRAESVAWVSERKDVLSAFFFLLTIGTYVRHVRKPSRIGYILLLLFFALGLLAKSMVATLPFVLLLLDYWPLKRISSFSISNLKHLLIEKIPLFVLAAGACAATALMPDMQTIITNAHRLPLSERLGNALVSCVIYLRQMVFPSGLAVPYPIAPDGLSTWKILPAIIFLAAISAGVIAWRKKSPFLLMGWLWYLGMLFPVIGVIQISPDAAHADRYTYLPEIGLAIAVTWLIGDLSIQWKRRQLVLGGLMIAVISALTICGHAQTSYWQNGQILWSRALACTSRNSVAHNNIGYVLYQKGDIEDAINQYNQALEINPNYAQAHFNLGVVFLKRGEVDDAIAEYNQALQIMPDYLEAHFDLGAALVLKGNLPEAIAQYRKVLKIKPDYAEACYNLGRVLLLNGDWDEAMVCLDKTAAGSPASPARWFDLGNEFIQERDWQCAVVCYRQAIKINPRLTDAYANLGVALSQKGETKNAMDAWQNALDINPDQIYVLNNLAWMLVTASDATLRNGAKALALAQQASQLSGGNNPAILRTLAAATAEDGNFALAGATARHALELAAEQKNDALVATLQKEIQLYEAGKPVQDSARE